MTNKEIAITFIQMCALESPQKAFDLFVAPDFKHHNQYFKGDRASLLNAMIVADSTHPNKTMTIKQVFQTDDRVALYSHVEKEDMNIAVVHIMRFENGKISEMWDLGQVMDANSPNENGIF